MPRGASPSYSCRLRFISREVYGRLRTHIPVLDSEKRLTTMVPTLLG